jgi:fructose-bisphosphate aldolase class 1
LLNFRTMEDRQILGPKRYNGESGLGHVRVVALSGGYTRAEACKRLALNHGMIASFSRALAQDLRRSMSGAEFDATLKSAIDEIYHASAVKVAA